MHVKLSERHEKTTVGVAALIADRYAAMSPAQCKIADYILANPHEAALLTIDRLAAAAQVSLGTVNRFPARVGLSGYSSLTSLLREEMRDALRPIDALVDTVGLNDLSRLAPWTQLMEEDCQRIRKIRAHEGDKAFAKAANMLATARRVYLLGFGSSAFLVEYADYYLSGLRDDTVVLANASGVEGANRKILGAGPDDVLVQMAFARYSIQALTLGQTLRNLGVRVIGITDDGDSPSAAGADPCFFIERKSGFILSGGGAAGLSLVEALLGATARALGIDTVQSRSARLTTILGEEIQA